jgi:Domain of unknown function (DUF3597)
MNRNIIEAVIQPLLKLLRPDMTAKEVEAALINQAANHTEKLDWKSIVDLLKLLDLDSSLAARKQLALEFGYKGKLDGSAKMNTWLHGQVMREIASRGIKIPRA